MTNNSEKTAGDNGIVFDSKSGISEEEQREILADINGIAEKNRQSLASASPAGRLAAKKNGGLFPLAVNGVAIIVLVGGFFLLSAMQSKDDVLLREGTKVFNTAERALINEIRQETLRLVEEKEKEINQIIEKMLEVDSLLEDLHSSNIDLTAEQRAAENNLKLLQDEYRQGLSALQDDRSRILENARVKEAALYAQLEARTRELTAASAQNEAALNVALSELERLTAEQEKASVLEAQLGVYFSVTAEQIRSGELALADETINTMRLFINTPAFQSNSAIQARKDFYIRNLAVLDMLLEEAIRNKAAALAGAVPGSISSQDELEQLRAQNAHLEESIAALNKTLEAANSQGSGASRRLTELQNTNTSLNSQLSTLRSENNSLTSANTNLRTTNATLESTVTQLNGTVTARDGTIADLRSQTTSLTQTIATRDSRIRALETQTAELDKANSDLRNRFAAILELSQ